MGHAGDTQETHGMHRDTQDMGDTRGDTWETHRTQGTHGAHKGHTGDTWDTRNTQGLHGGTQDARGAHGGIQGTHEGAHRDTRGTHGGYTGMVLTLFFLLGHHSPSPDPGATHKRQTFWPHQERVRPGQGLAVVSGLAVVGGGKKY